jgi:tight adherence protein B
MTRRRLRWFVGGVALLLLSMGGMVARAASPSPDEGSVQIRKVDVSAYPSVGVTVSVETETAPNDIQVTENGSPVDVITARPLLETGRGIDVVLAIDTSDSVAGEPLRQAVAAARVFVQSLPAPVGVGILTFSDEPRVVSPITTDHSVVLAALDTLVDTQRGTAMYDGLAAAAAMFSGPAQHNVVLLTDGSDVGSRTSLEQAITRTAKVPAAIFAVGLNGSQTDFPALGRLAEGTSGSFQPVDTAALSALYEGLAKQLGRQYLVIYRTTGPAGAQVTVGVRTPAGEDQSVVLLPRRSGPPHTAGGSGPLLFGTWGLLLTLGLVLLAAFLLAVMIVGGRHRARRDRSLAVRMSAPTWAQEEARRQDESPAAWVPGSLVQLGSAVAEVGGFKTSLDRKLERAGLPVTPGEVVGASIVTGLLGVAAGGLLFRNVVFALIVGAMGAVAPFLFVQIKMGRRIDQLQAQLPDVLMILASSMRAGHSFQQALDAVAKEVGDPGGAEFGRVVTEIRLGRPFDEALNALAERVGTEEFKWAIMGVNVQREVGGNLAEILDTLSQTVREREAVRRQVQVLSAEGRLSVKILMIMPFLLALYLTWINGSYMRLLWTTRPGLIFLVVGGLLMVAGALWSRKLVRIDV